MPNRHQALCLCYREGQSERSVREVWGQALLWRRSQSGVCTTTAATFQRVLKLADRMSGGLMSESNKAEALAKPYRIWPTPIPFRKDGTPVVGNFGPTIRQVVIIEAETFKRLIAEHPSLTTARFEVAEYD